MAKAKKRRRITTAHFRAVADQAADSRRLRVSALYLEGKRQWEIAAACSVNQGTICRDLAAIRAEWLESSVMNFNERQAQELAKLDNLERTYWTAWERSCQDAEVLLAKSVKEGGGSEGEPASERTETSKRIEGQSGNERFLAGVARCIELRCKILGQFVEKKELSGSVTLELVEEIVEAKRPKP